MNEPDLPSSSSDPPDSDSGPASHEPMQQPEKFCFDCGYPIDGIESHVCPECGRPFDPNNRTTYRKSLSYPKKVHTTPDHTEAHLLVHVLVEAGIPAIVLDAFPGMTGLGSASVFVEEPDAAAACEIIDEEVRRRRGETTTEEPIRPAWICANCGEEVDGHFEICWNCGAERPFDAPAE